MVERGIVGGLVAAALLAVVASAAESSEVPDRPRGSENVTVTGRRPSDQEVGSAISRFVAAHSKFTVARQLARWHGPVCPAVINMRAAYGRFIVKRIKTLARDVGAPVADACTPNVAITFVQKPQAVLDQIAKDRPFLLGFHFDSEREGLKTVTRPIQAWYMTATNGVIDDAYGRRPAAALGSKLTNGWVSSIVRVLIVVDSDFATGREVGPVADYIAILALSQASAPDDCTRLPSILNYLASGCAAAGRPVAMTSADLAYLRGLYAVSPSTLGNLQRSGIITQMNRILNEPDGTPAAADVPSQQQ